MSQVGSLSNFGGLGVPVHETRLMDECYGAPGNVLRIFAGRIMDASQRRVLSPGEFNSSDSGNLTGSAGFVDVSFNEPNLPIDLELCSLITGIGVEPAYQRNGFGRMLLGIAETIADYHNMRHIATTFVLDDRFRSMLEKRDYTFFNYGSQAFKRLP